ncbi:MAG: TIGR03013 family XrtA/PEP-CTERM system glycosyltransferase [Candidatus Acidiferrales bacterium]
MIRVLGQYIPVKTVILAITESILIVVSVILAAWIRFGSITEATWYLSRPYAASQIALVVIVCWLCLYYNDMYDLHVIARRAELVVRLMQALGTAVLLLALLYYFVPDLSLGRGVSAIATALTFVILLLWRMLVDAGKFFRPVHRVVIAGTGTSGIRLVREILALPELNIKVLGFLDETGKNIGKPLVNPGIVGGVADVEEFVRREQVDWVVLAFAERRGVMPTAELLRLKLSGIRVEDAHSLFEKLKGGVMLERLSPSWLVLSEGFRKDVLLMFTKRALDVVISAVALVIMSPIMLLASLAIVIESGMPVLFRQERVGLHGRNFSMLKFRSMRNDAEEGKAVWAARDDARVTRVGRILRPFRLDELPQLVNILRGDMSLVGPRPERPEFVQMLGEEIPYYHERHTVRPGLTGWAQIKYQYGSSVDDAKTKLEYELFYIKHLSLLLDLAIVFRTIQVVLFARGSR